MAKTARYMKSYMTNSSSSSLLMIDCFVCFKWLLWVSYGFYFFERKGWGDYLACALGYSQLFHYNGHPDNTDSSKIPAKINHIRLHAHTQKLGSAFYVGDLVFVREPRGNLCRIRKRWDMQPFWSKTDFEEVVLCRVKLMHEYQVLRNIQALSPTPILSFGKVKLYWSL